MATVSRIVKLANPHKRRAVRAVYRKRKTNPLHRRRNMSAKQIKHFGTARQKAALKAKRKRTVKRHSSSSSSSKRSAARNPAYLITLGAANPHKRSTKMAVRRKRRARVSNPRRRHNASRRRTRIVVAAPARRHRRRRVSNPVIHRRRRRALNPRRRHNRRRNPISVMGQTGAKNIGTLLLGGLVGVAATKFIPTLIPAGMLPSSNIVRAAVSAASAYAAGMLAEKLAGAAFGQAVAFGGYMQAASVALNAFLPSIGSRIGMNGMRELIPGQFTVPQNPLRLPPAPPVAVRANMNGLARAYGSAF